MEAFIGAETAEMHSTRLLPEDIFVGSVRFTDLLASTLRMRLFSLFLSIICAIKRAGGLWIRVGELENGKYVKINADDAHLRIAQKRRDVKKRLIKCTGTKKQTKQKIKQQTKSRTKQQTKRLTRQFLLESSPSKEDDSPWDSEDESEVVIEDSTSSDEEEDGAQEGITSGEHQEAYGVS